MPVTIIVKITLKAFYNYYHICLKENISVVMLSIDEVLLKNLW